MAICYPHYKMINCSFILILCTELFTSILLFFHEIKLFFLFLNHYFNIPFPISSTLMLLTDWLDVRSSIGINHHNFTDSDLLMPLDINGKPASLLTDAVLGGKTPNSVLQKADHAMHDFSAAEHFRSTSAETTSVEQLLHGLQMKCA